MACVRKRQVGKGFRWVLDYRDQQGRRHWETTKGNRKEAEGLLAERVREIGRGTYRAPAERVIFEELGEAYLKDAAANVRATIEENILAPPEIQALLGAADGRWRIIILTAVLTGLREGELLGLAWGGIDWTARQIHVRQQYTAGRFSELKTKASRRRVDLPGELVAELRRISCQWAGTRSPIGSGNSFFVAVVAKR